MAEDEDYEQDSEAYRKWRSGEDNDRYASSKTPSETGARSGSYTTPKSENDEYTSPDEDDNSEKLPWYVWAFLIITTIPFLIVAIGSADFQFGDGGSDGKNPSEWPSVEGTIEYTRVEDKFITEEYCEDRNDDGYFDDYECWKDFVYVAEVSYIYTVENTSDLNGQEGCEDCSFGEIVELWESHWVDVLKREGEDKLFQEFINATDERLAVNSTVKIFYNPENAGEVYSEFGEVYEDVEIGVFLTAIGAFCCVAISFVAIFLGIAQRVGGIGEDYGLNRGGSSGVFGSDNSRSGRRNSRAVRRSGGSSRSGGGGRSGSGSRGGGRSSGGSRSGGGGRRR